MALPVLLHVKTKMTYFDLAPCSVFKVSRLRNLIGLSGVTKYLSYL